MESRTQWFCYCVSSLSFLWKWWSISNFFIFFEKANEEYIWTPRVLCRLSSTVYFVVSFLFSALTKDFEYRPSADEMIHEPFLEDCKEKKDLVSRIFSVNRTLSTCNFWLNIVTFLFCIRCVKNWWLYFISISIHLVDH